MARKYRLFAALLLVVTSMQLCGMQKKNVLTGAEKNDALIILVKDEGKIWARVKDNPSKKNGFLPLDIQNDVAQTYGVTRVEGKTNVYTASEKSAAYPWIKVANVDHQGYVRLLWKLDSKVQNSASFKQALKEAKIWEVFGLKKKTTDDDDSFLESYGPTIIVGLLGIGLLGGAYWFYKKYFRR